MKDYYKILNVEKTSSESDIKKSYRKLAMEYHPDKNQDDKLAEEKFKDIAEAYSILGDVEKRKKYDRVSLNSNQYANVNWGGMDINDIMEDLKGTGFSENFDHLFGGSFGKGGARGSDILVELNITLEDVFNGCEKTFSYYEKGIHDITKDPEYITVYISKGVTQGQKIRIKNRGNSHPINSELPKGDLIISINILPNLFFRRHFNDIYYKADIDLYTAILGGEVNIPTLVSNNKIKIKIPELSKQNQRLKLKSKGLPVYNPNYNSSSYSDLNQHEVGDMYVELNIIMPTSLSKEEREIFSKLKKAKNENN